MSRASLAVPRLSLTASAILPHIAQSYDIPYDRVSHLPTLAQGGYAAGIRA